MNLLRILLRALPSLGGLQVVVGSGTMLALGTPIARYVAIFGVLITLIYGAVLASRQP